MRELARYLYAGIGKKRYRATRGLYGTQGELFVCGDWQGICMRGLTKSGTEPPVGFMTLKVRYSYAWIGKEWYRTIGLMAPNVRLNQDLTAKMRSLILMTLISVEGLLQFFCPDILFCSAAIFIKYII